MSDLNGTFIFSYSLKLNVVILPVNPRFSKNATQKKSHIYTIFGHKNNPQAY